VKNPLLRSTALLVGLLTACIPTIAHHGSTVEYDMKKVIAMEGTVTEFQWKNPHVYVIYDVKDDQGNVVSWGAETHAPLVCETQDNWSKSTLKPGDQITVSVFPSNAGSPRGLLAKLVLNGKVILDDTTRGRQPAQ
jgi:hypothetical protein